jgi:hypothetical protein
MPRIPIARVENGMVLLRPAKSPSGALLVESGVRITEEIRVKFVGAGVRHAHIVGGPDDTRLREELSALEARFSKTEETQPMRMLQELVREHLEELYR